MRPSPSLETDACMCMSGPSNQTAIFRFMFITLKWGNIMNFHHIKFVAPTIQHAPLIFLDLILYKSEYGQIAVLIVESLWPIPPVFAGDAIQNEWDYMTTKLVFVFVSLFYTITYLYFNKV